VVGSCYARDGFFAYPCVPVYVYPCGANTGVVTCAVVVRFIATGVVACSASGLISSRLMYHGAVSRCGLCVRVVA
jgi:hypothetical protein